MNPKKAIAIIFLCAISSLGTLTVAKSGKTLLRDTFIRSTRNLPISISLNARLKAMTAACEKSVSENFAFKRGLSWADARLQYYLTGRIVSQQVLLGKDGWLFYKTKTDGNPLDDYRGVGDVSPQDRKEILTRLLTAKAILNREGIRFVLMIPPNKEVVYPNKMPRTVPSLNPVTRTDRLVAYLRENGFTDIVYPKRELIRERDAYQLYFKYDTHWNQLGAYIGERELLTFLGKRAESLGDQPIEAGSRCSGDLAAMAQLSDVFNDDVDYRILPAVPLKPSEKRENAAAPYPEYLMFVGDSFREHLEPFLFADFSKAFVTHKDAFDPSVIHAEKPNIFVYEVVERYSGMVSHYNRLPRE